MCWDKTRHESEGIGESRGCNIKQHRRLQRILYKISGFSQTSWTHN